MTHKQIIDLANGMPIFHHKSGESEAQANLSYELVIEEAMPKVIATDKPKHLTPRFFSHAEMHELFFNPIIEKTF